MNWRSWRKSQVITEMQNRRSEIQTVIYTIMELKEPIQSAAQMKYRSSHWFGTVSSKVVRSFHYNNYPDLSSVTLLPLPPRLVLVASGAPSVQNLSHNFSVAQEETCDFIAQLLGANESGRNEYQNIFQRLSQVGQNWRRGTASMTIDIRIWHLKLIQLGVRIVLTPDATAESEEYQQQPAFMSTNQMENKERF
jgi:hypothetical protein